MTDEACTTSLRVQAKACRALGSPFASVLLDLAADGDLGDLAPFFDRWPGADVQTHIREATAIRFMGALHHLVLSGAEPGLAAQYPEAKADTDKTALRDVVRVALADHAADIHAFMGSPPQTNEVGRSFCLAPGFLQVVLRYGLPLRILEIGSSAGLNLQWDRFRYDFAGAVWGDPDSPVRLANEWRGGRPDLASARVVERAGCDQSPIDVRQDDDALRLQAYVWPDQFERMARLRGAIAIARRSPTPPEQADAADWCEARVRPEPGVATVLFHSVMWQYMPDSVQARVRAAIEAAGAMASPEAPVAWLRMEPDPDSAAAPMQIRLAGWPSGEERLLARAHPHGAWAEWLGPFA